MKFLLGKINVTPMGIVQTIKDQLLPWFANLMCALGKWEAIDDPTSFPLTETIDSSALDKDKAANQEYSNSVTK